MTNIFLCLNLTPKPFSYQDTVILSTYVVQATGRGQALELT